MLADVLTGGSPAGGDCPVATAVISGVGKGDRLGGSPEVKVSSGWGLAPVRSTEREASNLAGRSKSEPEKPRKFIAHLKWMVGVLGVPRLLRLGEGQCCRRRNWVQAADELPGVGEGGMPGRNRQRKHGTTRGSPRRSRTAKAVRISLHEGETALCLRVGRMGSNK
jgi:hypothetical protein